MTLVLWLLPVAVLVAGLVPLVSHLGRLTAEVRGLRSRPPTSGELRLAVVDTRAEIAALRAQYRHLRRHPR